MNSGSGDKFSAGEQGIGYLYQPRLALLKLFKLPEDTAAFIEGEDDIDFKITQENRILASLKHKAKDGRLTDLATDFWKSVRIWLERYKSHGAVQSDLAFFLFTTESISENSFLAGFTSLNDKKEITEKFQEAIGRSSSTVVQKAKNLFDELEQVEKSDFLSRIEIFEQSPRIEDLPEQIINDHLRTVRRKFRESVFERLEGWWTNLVIQQLTGQIEEPIYGHELSDKLSSIAAEYQNENLPIIFRNKLPSGEIDPETDDRLFVQQLRALSLSAERIQYAIIDYYRAFEQRSSWAREELLIAGEVEEYEDRLVEEWQRYKAIVCEQLTEGSDEPELINAGKELLKWAELKTEHLRIRERVTEPYVVRGGFHILANNRPLPKVHWHPRFLDQVQMVLEDSS